MIDHGKNTKHGGFQEKPPRDLTSPKTARLATFQQAATGISHAQSPRISGLTSPMMGSHQTGPVQLKGDSGSVDVSGPVQMDGGELSWLDLALEDEATGERAAIQMIGPDPASNSSAIKQIAKHGVEGTGGKLPHLDRIQSAFGQYDLEGTSCFVGGKAGQSSKQMGAQAYAIGNRIAFKEQPSLHTAAHEAAHVIQQRAGVSLEGDVGRPGDPYERHADAVADRVVRGESVEDLLDAFH